jgi:gluconokinase
MTDQTSTATIVLMGVSGSGKSTVMQRIVERRGWSSAEADHYHSPSNVAKMASGAPLTDEDRWPWLRALAAWIGQREAAGENAVLTCSALKREYRDILRDGHPSVRFVQLTVPREILQARLEQRQDHYMPASLLGSQIVTLEDLHPDEPGFAVRADLPPDTIVDEIETQLGLRRGGTS